MPVLSHGVVARTFYSPVAAAGAAICLLLLVLAKMCNALEITLAERPLALKRACTVRTIILKHGSKTAHFHFKIGHREAPWHGTRLIPHPFAFL